MCGTRRGLAAHRLRGQPLTARRSFQPGHCSVGADRDLGDGFRFSPSRRCNDPILGDDDIVRRHDAVGDERRELVLVEQ
jgi:hypothetical protein